MWEIIKRNPVLFGLIAFFLLLGIGLGVGLALTGIFAPFGLTLLGLIGAGVSLFAICTLPTIPALVLLVWRNEGKWAPILKSQAENRLKRKAILKESTEAKKKAEAEVVKTEIERLAKRFQLDSLTISLREDATKEAAFEVVFHAANPEKMNELREFLSKEYGVKPGLAQIGISTMVGSVISTQLVSKIYEKLQEKKVQEQGSSPAQVQAQGSVPATPTHTTVSPSAVTALTAAQLEAVKAEVCAFFRERGATSKDISVKEERGTCELSWSFVSPFTYCPLGILRGINEVNKKYGDSTIVQTKKSDPNNAGRFWWGFIVSAQGVVKIAQELDKLEKEAAAAKQAQAQTPTTTTTSTTTTTTTSTPPTPGLFTTPAPTPTSTSTTRTPAATTTTPVSSAPRVAAPSSSSSPAPTLTAAQLDAVKTEILDVGIKNNFIKSWFGNNPQLEVNSSGELFFKVKDERLYTFDGHFHGWGVSATHVTLSDSKDIMDARVAGFVKNINDKYEGAAETTQSWNQGIGGGCDVHTYTFGFKIFAEKVREISQALDKAAAEKQKSTVTLIPRPVVFSTPPAENTGGGPATGNDAKPKEEGGASTPPSPSQ